MEKCNTVKRFQIIKWINDDVIKNILTKLQSLQIA